MNVDIGEKGLKNWNEGRGFDQKGERGGFCD